MNERSRSYVGSEPAMVVGWRCTLGVTIIAIIPAATAGDRDITWSHIAEKKHCYSCHFKRVEQPEHHRKTYLCKSTHLFNIGNRIRHLAMNVMKEQRNEIPVFPSCISCCAKASVNV